MTKEMKHLIESLPETDPDELEKLMAQWQAAADAEVSKASPRTTKPVASAKPEPGLQGDTGFQKIGSLTPTTSPTREAADSSKLRSPPKPSGSSTIGSLNQDVAVANLIGAARGGIGSLRQLKMIPAHRKPEVEPEWERACRLINNWLSRPNGRSPSVMKCAAELVNAVTASTTGPDWDRAVLAQLTTFFHHFPRQPADVTIEPTLLNDWLEDLAGYPLYAIEVALGVCRRRAGQWRPPAAEVIRWAETYSSQYRRLRDDLRRLGLA